MDTIANYAIQIKPLLWIVLSIFGGIAFQRTRTVSVLIIAIGLWIETIIIVLTPIFPYEMHLSNEGELLEQSMGILLIDFQMIGD